MKSTVEPLEGNKVKLSVEVEAAEFEEAVDAAFKKIAKEVRLPGLPARQGAPQGPRGPPRARWSAGSRRSRTPCPSTTPPPSSSTTSTSSRAPEIDITGGQEAGDVAFDAVVEVRPVDRGARLRRPVGHARAPRRRRGGHRRPDRPHARPRQHARGRRPAGAGGRHRHHRHRRHPRRRGPVRAHRRRLQLHGRLRRHHPRGRRAPGRRRRPAPPSSFAATHPDPDEERELQFELDGQGREGEGPPRAHRRVGDRGLGVRDRRRAARQPGRPDDHASARRRPRWRCARRPARRSPRSSPTSCPSRWSASEMQERLQDLAMRLQAQGMQLEQYLADDRHGARGSSARSCATPPRRPSRSTSRCGPWPTPRASSAPRTTSPRSSRASPSGSARTSTRCASGSSASARCRRYAPTSGSARRSSGCSSRSRCSIPRVRRSIAASSSSPATTTKTTTDTATDEVAEETEDDD